MPSIKDKSTVEAIARAFCGEGKRNKTDTLRIVGYKPSYYLGGRSAEVVWGNERVMAAIARIDNKLAGNLDLTRAAQYKRLLGAYDMAVTQKDPRAIKSVLAEINLMLGYQREAAPNEEREQARAARMSQEDREVALLAARLRTEQEARKGIKLVGTG